MIRFRLFLPSHFSHRVSSTRQTHIGDCCLQCHRASQRAPSSPVRLRACALFAPFPRGSMGVSRRVGKKKNTISPMTSQFFSREDSGCFSGVLHRASQIRPPVHMLPSRGDSTVGGVNFIGARRRIGRARGGAQRAPLAGTRIVRHAKRDSAGGGDAGTPNSPGYPAAEEQSADRKRSETPEFFIGGRRSKTP